LAATEKTQSNDPDWTCGTKIGKAPDGTFYVVDHKYGQLSPSKVEVLLKNTASQDGAMCEQNIPQDPGQAGKSQVLNLTKMLGAYPIKSAPVTGDKIVRFSPFAAHAEAGNVKVLRADWNERWFGQLEGFPDLKHDDDADSTSQAFNAFTQSNTGLIEFYEAEARKLLAEKLERDDPAPITLTDGGVLVRPPTGNINTLYDMKGKLLMKRPDGTFLVTPQQAQLLRRSGFVEV
jgi:predicted phage terminase large subunit-like protein